MQNPWAVLRNLNDADIPLFATALLIAKDEYPELDSVAYESRLQAYSRSIEKLAKASRR